MLFKKGNRSCALLLFRYQKTSDWHKNQSANDNIENTQHEKTNHSEMRATIFCSELLKLTLYNIAHDIVRKFVFLCLQYVSGSWKNVLSHSITCSVCHNVMLSNSIGLGFDLDCILVLISSSWKLLLCLT